MGLIDKIDSTVFYWDRDNISSTFPCCSTALFNFFIMPRASRPLGVVGVHPAFVSPSRSPHPALLPDSHPRRIFYHLAQNYRQNYFSLLKQFGLRADDCLSEDNFPVVRRVTLLLAPHLHEARVRRHIRAIDLHQKHEVLPEWAQQHQRPDIFYLWPLVNDLEYRRLEQIYYK